MNMREANWIPGCRCNSHPFLIKRKPYLSYTIYSNSAAQSRRQLWKSFPSCTAIRNSEAGELAPFYRYADFFSVPKVYIGRKLHNWITSVALLSCYSIAAVFVSIQSQAEIQTLFFPCIYRWVSESEFLFHFWRSHLCNCIACLSPPCLGFAIMQHQLAITSKTLQ